MIVSPPSDDSHLAAWAHALAEARVSGGVVALAQDEPRSAADAFLIQQAVARRLQDTPAGWKTAGASAEGFPLVAPILSRGILPSPAAVGALRDQPLVVEVEFGLRLRAPMTDQGACHDGRALVCEVFVALELCRTRLAAAQPSRALFLADGLANAALVVGGGTPASLDFDFSGRRVQLFVNGASVADRTTDDTANRTADDLLWLAEQRRVHGGLAGGAVVITGSLTGITPLRDGDVAHAIIEGVGEAEVSLR